MDAVLLGKLRLLEFVQFALLFVGASILFFRVLWTLSSGGVTTTKRQATGQARPHYSPSKLTSFALQSLFVNVVANVG